MKSLIKLFIIAATPFFIYSCSSKSVKEVDEHNEAGGLGHEENRVWLSAMQIKSVGIEYGKIEMKELTATIRANGVLKVPNNFRASVTTLYGGVIQNIYVQVGEDVRKGQVLATVANPQFIKLQEEYLSLGSRITLAEQELQRQKELNEGNAGAGKNLQAATADLNGLNIRRAAVRQELQLMGINSNTLTKDNLVSALAVKSPIDGVVTDLFAKIGSFADASSPVAEVVDNGSLHLDLNVFEKDLPLLKEGQIIHFTLTNNPVSEYDAEIFSIGAAFENESKTIPVHAKVNGKKSGLIDGMNITGIVSLDKALTPAVQNDAVVRDNGRYYIFLVLGKSTMSFKDAEGGEHNNEAGMEFERIEVIPGVSDMGYTAITPVRDLPSNAEIVNKSAFFVNAKLINSGEHEH